MDEHLAIAWLKQGDLRGLDQLMDRYQVQAVRAAQLITRDRALAEDVVQSAFLRLYERIGSFDSTRPFKPWFFRLVVNDAIKAAQGQSRFSSYSSADEDVSITLAQALAAVQSDPSYIAEQHELRDQVRAAINQLPPSQRAAIVYRYYLHMPEAEIATAIDRTPGTVKQLLHRARARMRGLLQSNQPESDERDAMTILEEVK